MNRKQRITLRKLSIQWEKIHDMDVFNCRFLPIDKQLYNFFRKWEVYESIKKNGIKA